MPRRAPTCAGLRPEQRHWLEYGLSDAGTAQAAAVMNELPVHDSAPHDPDPRPQPPEAPGPNECCGSGCPLCVLDLYADELAVYRQRLAEWTARHPEAQG